MRVDFDVTEAQLDAVLADLSAEDRAELDASQIADARASFLEGLARSTLKGCVLVDERPVGVFGCVPDANIDGGGIPWFVSTPGFKSEKRLAAMFSAQVVRRMRAQHPYLHNWVHRGHTTAIRWLEWLGFTVDTSRRLGPGGEFLHFEWSRSSV